MTAGTEGGKTAYVPSAGSGFLSYQGANSDHYIVPAEARPYVGRQLDPSLFDVSALLRGHVGAPAATSSGASSAAARIPVSLAFARGAAVSPPPGVTLTSVGASAASGYLTSGSAPAFGAALRAAIGADVAAGHPAGRGPLFGGLTSMSLAATGLAAPTAGAGALQPRYPLSVLQVNAVGLTGGPADGAAAILVNTDSVAKWHGMVPVDGGIGRVAVPAGHYSAALLFVDFDTHGQPVALRMVALNDFTVAAADTTAVSFDERAATVPFSVSTPRPATQDSLVVGWLRTDATGASAGFEGAGNGLVAAYSNTVARPAIGSVRYLVQWGATGTAAGPAYRYDLAFKSEGIPADQHHDVRARQLATVQQKFYTDPAAGAAPGEMVESMYSPDSPDILMPTPPATGTLTDYVGVATPDLWLQGYFEPTGIFLLAATREFAPRRTYAQEWGHGPAAPRVGSYGPALILPAKICVACASGGDLKVGFNEVGDSEPDHVGTVAYGGSTHYTLYQDGVAVYDAANALGTSLTGIPNAPTVYREVLDTDLTTVPGLSESTSTHTDLTFRYIPGVGPGDSLPADDWCDRSGPSAAPCQILPILDLDYRLATDLTGTSSARVQTMRLDVSHLAYAGHGSRAPITVASVSLSFDHGKSWTPAAIFGAAGHYLARWRNPASAAAASPDLRVTARDAAGGSISQTIVNAYVIAASPAMPVPNAAANVVPACGPAAPGNARCFAMVRTDVHAGKGMRSASAPPPGYGPADLRSAYNLPATGGSGQTIAIVDAGDDPAAEADLAVYRATYGLPPCTTANGCFRKVNEQGAASPLPPDFGWDNEISIDLDLASAACSACRLVLVEAGEPSLQDLAAAANTAAAVGANEVSNSYGTTEGNGMQALESDYRHPGVAYLAASGDSGYGIPNYPAVFSSVISVGGTSLAKASNARGWSERAWKQASSGCSAWIDKPFWQHDPNCPGRMTADVAADADPQTGPAIYDTDNDAAGWLVAGGTSAAAPFVAGVIALAGNPAAFPNASFLYTHAAALYDVAAGDNITTFGCGGDYQCDALPGYDGPTGNGTPNGTAAF